MDSLLIIFQEIRFGNQSHTLSPHVVKHRQELYSSKGDNLSFKGLVSHSLTLRKAEEASAGMDVALEAFRNNMASISQEHEARKYVCLNCGLFGLDEYWNNH